ncbi:hypothetical protein FQN54_006410 [Arachnomyces sp. PD_36]|nr:hypothetical protein FQN54_006410 [Arachnomyces sp. PD_36]
MPKKLDLDRLRRVLRVGRKVPRPLLALPIELIDAISALLEPSDLCSLRLTCKFLYRTTVRHFGRTCCQRIETDLSFSNLQRLTLIAQHQQLRHHVHHISFYTEYHIDRAFFGRGFSWNRDPSGHLNFPQRSVQQLKDILTLLVNCSSFHISGVHICEDTIQPDLLGPSDVVTIILHIVADTGLSVTYFSVDFKQPNGGGTCAMDARRLYMPDFQKAGFTTAWSHLQELSLREGVEPGTDDIVSELALNAPNLRKLAINFDRGQATESVIHRLSSADSLPQLQHLDLQCASLERADQLLLFLRRFRHSLRNLYLESISFRVGKLRTVLATLSSDFTSLESVWLLLIRDSGGLIHFPALLSNPFANGSDGRRFIYGIKKRLCQGDRVIWVSYRGPNMDVALRTLAKHAEPLRF